jgi:hypothetical protein
MYNSRKLDVGGSKGCTGGSPGLDSKSLILSKDGLVPRRPSKGGQKMKLSLKSTGIKPVPFGSEDGSVKSDSARSLAQLKP